MSELVTVHLAPFEALIIATMLKEANDQLMGQVSELGQDERFFLQQLQNIQKLFPEVPK